MNDLPIEISVLDAKTIVETDSDYLLLDCRNQNEYDFVRIDGCKLISMGELQQRLSELDDYRAKRIIVYCHIGGRSLQVASWLRQQGFPRVQSMSGGVDAWAEQIDPSLPRY